jgi:hypothetical protein
MLAAHPDYAVAHGVFFDLFKTDIDVAGQLPGDESVHRARVAEATREGAGIDARKHRDAVLFQEVGKGFFATVIARETGEFPHDERRNPRMRAFLVGLVRSVISDHRIGQHDCLSLE